MAETERGESERTQHTTGGGASRRSSAGTGLQEARPFLRGGAPPISICSVSSATRLPASSEVSARLSLGVSCTGLGGPRSRPRPIYRKGQSTKDRKLRSGTHRTEPVVLNPSSSSSVLVRDPPCCSCSLPPIPCYSLSKLPLILQILYQLLL